MAYEHKNPPRDHQGTALVRVANKPDDPSDEDVFAWLMEMGTGKTWVGLTEFGQREDEGELDDLLIFAPAGAYGNWWREDDEEPGEIQKHLPDQLRERLLVVPWVSGGGVRHKRRLQHLLDYRAGPRALVVNIEAMSTVRAAQTLCKEFLTARGRRSMINVDESTTIKNSQAKRTKFMCDLGRMANARRIMSGLVAPNSPLDLYSQFEFLDWRILGHRSYYSFRSRYAITRKMNFGGRSVQVVVGYRNVEELWGLISPYSYRVLKKDCLDLEPKDYRIRDVTLTTEQKRIYKEIKEHATAAIDESNHVTATIVITQMIRLHQVLCGFVVDEEGREHQIPENRTRELVQILSEHSGKAIIWTAYDPCMRNLAVALRKEFGDESVAMYWGGNRNKRDGEERRWKTDPKCRFMLATAAAGGKGNTWTQANLVVYHANDENLENREQSEDRAHRDGQTEQVTYIDLMARGTVDEKRVKSLRNKINLATVITGDNYKEWLI